MNHPVPRCPAVPDFGAVDQRLSFLSARKQGKVALSAHASAARDLSRSDGFLNIMQSVTGEILGDLATKHFRQLFVVTLAKLAEGARSCDNDEIRNPHLRPAC